MSRLLLAVPIALLSVCVAFLTEFWVKLYALSTVPVTALTMAQGFHILLLALGIGVLVMFMLVFLFLALELGLKKEGGGGLVCLDPLRRLRSLSASRWRGTPHHSWGNSSVRGTFIYASATGLRLRSGRSWCPSSNAPRRSGEWV